MNFALTDIQLQFRETLRRFASQHPKGKDECWPDLAALGVLGAFLPESHGGLGDDSVDAMVILEALGRGLLSASIIETVIVAGGLIDRLGSEQQRRRFLPRLAAGRLKLALADGPGFWATETADGIRLDGRQDIVIGAPDSDEILVLAHSAGQSGRTLFIIERDRPGLRVQSYRTIDDRLAAAVTAHGLRLDREDRIGPVCGADGAVVEVLDLAVAAQCAEAVGIMASLLNQTVAHLQTRTQFGQPLTHFQALQHRLADMAMAYELALSLTLKAAILCKATSGTARQAAVSAAKIQVSEAAERIGHEAIQMHGAIGMSLELPVGHAVKRLKAMASQYGSADYHLRRYQALSAGRAA